jgi:outer membrane protein assembly factor BamB
MRPLLLAVLVLGLSGCSTMKGWFSMDDKEDPRRPADLQEIKPSADLRKLWSVGVGNGQGKGLYRLQPALAGDLIYVASNDGQVMAIEHATGRERWERELDMSLSGGVGVYRDSLFVGSVDGELLRLSADDGEIVWSVPISGEVLAPPQSDGRVVVVQSYDGKLHGYDHASGERLWSYDSNLPVLTLRGTGTPILADGRVFAAFATGRVLAFDARSGSIEWEARVAIPQGRSEIERIVDIDGSMALVGGELFAASYQGRLMALDGRTGNRLWQQDMSSFSGVSLGFGNDYVAHENGTVMAFLRNGQGLRWEQDALAWRELSRPTPVSSYLAVVDFEGYLHLLSQVDGSFVARERVDGDGARADMISDGRRLYVYGNSGKLIAYEVRARE